MTGMTGDNAIFAAKLRQHCASETSIADICRDTGINRQQFNKYLAGRTIPSVRTLRKICVRLNVREDALLGASGNTDVHSDDTRKINGSAYPDSRISALGKDLDRLMMLYLPGLRNVARLQNADFGPGAYQVYFPLGDFSGHILRGYMEVWWHKDQLMFTRMTRLKEPGKATVAIRARHFGVALSAKGEISLVGRNRMSPFQLSVINLQPDLMLKRFFVGLSLTHAGKPIACRVVLERLDSRVTRRKGLGHCGLVRLRDDSVPRFVQEALNPDNKRGPTLQLPDIEQMIGSTLVG